MAQEDRNFTDYFNSVWYKDRGCEDISPSCVLCPLPMCRYDDYRVVAVYKKQQRHERILNMQNQGMTEEEIANVEQVKPLTISKILRKVQIGEK